MRRHVWFDCVLVFCLRFVSCIYQIKLAQMSRLINISSINSTYLIYHIYIVLLLNLRFNLRLGLS